jgi:hypothetical protein
MPESVRAGFKAGSVGQIKIQVQNVHRYQPPCDLREPAYRRIEWCGSAADKRWPALTGTHIKSRRPAHPKFGPVSGLHEHSRENAF